MDRYKIIKKLDKLKTEHPEQKIIVEIPNGYVELKIGDALIYEGIRGEIVIDSEQANYEEINQLVSIIQKNRQTDIT